MLQKFGALRYLANQLVFNIGVTLIWRKAVAILTLFKFGGWTKNHQTAKLKSPPNKLSIQLASPKSLNFVDANNTQPKVNKTSIQAIRK